MAKTLKWENYYELFMYSPTVAKLYTYLESRLGRNFTFFIEQASNALDYDVSGLDCDLSEYAEVLNCAVLSAENDPDYPDPDHLEYVLDNLIQQFTQHYGKEVVKDSIDEATHKKLGTYKFKRVSSSEWYYWSHSGTWEISDEEYCERNVTEGVMIPLSKTKNKSIPEGATYVRTFDDGEKEYLRVGDSMELEYYSTSCGKWMPSILYFKPALYRELMDEGRIKPLSSSNTVTPKPNPSVEPVTTGTSEIIKQKGNNTMARIVNVTIMDNSAGIKDDSNRLVARYKEITTTKTNEQVKMEILMTKNVAAKLKTHNYLRKTLVDESILLNTGQEVMLRPVELHELTFTVSDA